MIDEPQPPRGKRPKNRREITLRTASQLFARNGYSTVSMSEIAESMNVSAMAIYKHFSSKSSLLISAIQEGIDRYRRVLDSADTAQFSDPRELVVLLEQLADISLDLREWGVLWQRELRSLPLEIQRDLRANLSAVAAAISQRIARLRPDISPRRTDLLGWCAMGTFVSVGFHSLSLPRSVFSSLLVSMTTDIVCVDLGMTEQAVGIQKHPSNNDESRRDQLVARATELFAERGYSSVGVDDIGEAAGIAGPSVYIHFANKQTILAESIRRANDQLSSELHAVLSDDTGPAVKLGRLVSSFVQLALDNRFVVQVVLSELNQLEAADREFALREQRAYIDSWTNLLIEARPQNRVAARMRVHAVLLVINEAIQTPHLRAQRELPNELCRIALAMLEMSA